MADAKTDALVKSVEALLQEKRAVAARESELIDGLNAVLEQMGYRVVATDTIVRRRGRPPGSGNGRRAGRKPGRPRARRRRRGRRAAQGGARRPGRPPKTEAGARRRGRPPKTEAAG
jgi:hypothetical protein